MSEDTLQRRSGFACGVVTVDEKGKEVPLVILEVATVGGQVAPLCLPAHLAREIAAHLVLAAEQCEGRGT